MGVLYCIFPVQMNTIGGFIIMTIGLKNVMIFGF